MEEQYKGLSLEQRFKEFIKLMDAKHREHSSIPSIQFVRKLQSDLFETAEESGKLADWMSSPKGKRYQLDTRMKHMERNFLVYVSDDDIRAEIARRAVEDKLRKGEITQEDLDKGTVVSHLTVELLDKVDTDDYFKIKDVLEFEFAERQLRSRYPEEVSELILGRKLEYPSWLQKMILARRKPGVN